MLHPAGKAGGWHSHPPYVQKEKSPLCPRVLASLDAGVVKGRTSGYQGNAGSAVSNKQNYESPTRLVGEKAKVYYGVITIEFPQEKMVKLHQFFRNTKHLLKKGNAKEQRSWLRVNFTSIKWERFSVTLCTEYKLKPRD